MTCSVPFSRLTTRANPVFARLQHFLQSRIATYLVVIYGLGSVLGYGLHELWDCQHCHPSANIVSVDLGNYQDVYNFDTLSSNKSTNTDEQSPSPTTTYLASQEDCPICCFLSQAQTPVDLAPNTYLVEDVASEIPVSESIAPLYLPANHLARGPPLC